LMSSSLIHGCSTIICPKRTSSRSSAARSTGGAGYRGRLPPRPRAWYNERSLPLGGGAPRTSIAIINASGAPLPIWASAAARLRRQQPGSVSKERE
jgi:hypothetical protein